jgi:hypothetical protein
MLPTPMVSRSSSVTTIVILMLRTIRLSTVPCDAARILFVVGNMNSHVIYFSRLAVELARLRHVTRLLVLSNARVPDFLSGDDNDDEPLTNFTYTIYAVDGNEPYANSRRTSELLVKIALSDSYVEKFTLLSSFGDEVLRHWEADCVRLLDDQRLMEDLRAADYDFAVMDPAAIYCYYVVPHMLRIPYATMSVAMSAWMYRVPRLPSFASTTLGFTDRMTFAERLMSFVAEMAQLLTVNETSYYADKYVPRESLSSSAVPLNELTMVQQSSLWFYMEDIAVGYAMPQMPNTVAVGDIMAGRPGRPLPIELENFVATSGSGQAIVVSFGSYFDFMPEIVIRQFCDAFVRIGSRFRVVWKVKNADACSAVDILKIVSWMPQNDLLADPRVRLFISHGGMNSLIEAVYHAKPVIVCPIALDQSYNAAAAVSKGYAIRMDIRNFTADSLLANIEKILSDRKYLVNAKLSSAILKDRSETPAERVSRMIDHVIKYGDKHLRTGAFELNIFQFMMLDIFIFLFSVALGIVAFSSYCCYCFYNLCIVRRLKRGISKTKDD